MYEQIFVYTRDGIFSFSPHLVKIITLTQSIKQSKIFGNEPYY